MKHRIFKNETLYKIVFFWILLLVVFRWNTFTTPFDRDEGAYSFVAREFRQQGILPYQETFDHKPPLIYHTYSLAQSVSEEIWAPRILSFTALVLTSFLTAYLANILYGNKAGYFALLLSVPMLSHPLLMPFAANTEVFMLPFMLFSIVLYFRYIDSYSPWGYFLFGISSSLSVFYKPISLGVIGFVALLWLLKENMRNKTFEFLFLLTLGCAVVILLILFPLVNEGLLYRMYQYVIVYSRDVTYEPIVMRRLFKHLFSLFISWPLLSLLPIIYFLKRPNYWWFFLGALMLSVVFIFNAQVGHYYLLITPFWVIILAKTTLIVSSQLTNKSGADRLKNILFIIIFASSMAPLIRQVFISPEKLVTYVYGPGQPFEEAYLLGKKLKEISDVEDTVYIAGHEPEILYYSDRDSASRFIYAYPLMSGPYQKEFREEYYKEMSQGLPDYIVLSAEHYKPESDNISVVSFWNNLLKLSYEKKGVVVRDGSKVYWTTNQEKIGRLLLYKRK